MNLQLDHFPMITFKKQKPNRVVRKHPRTQPNARPHGRACRLTHTACDVLKHGFHNVSRWMTWLPISLKNAAKCDKWYQLQNHSITESLNANGAREKSLPDHPRACRISQCRTKTQSQKSLGLMVVPSIVGRVVAHQTKSLSLHGQCNPL